jgi:hypothetical protein
VSSISALFGPGLHIIPVSPKVSVLVGLCDARFIQTSNLNESKKL